MPKPKVIEDHYGQEIEVSPVMGGDGMSVSLEITERVPTPPPAPLKHRTEITHSKLDPDQARNLAKQLERAAEECER